MSTYLGIKPHGQLRHSLDKQLPPQVVS